jgi:hypothetical protein
MKNILGTSFPFFGNSDDTLLRCVSNCKASIPKYFTPLTF